MPEITVNFVHPTDRRVVTVAVDDSMTAKEAIGELLANNFIPAAPDGAYELSVNGNNFRGDQTFAEAGVVGGSKIRVNPATDAGAGVGRWQ